MLFTARDLQQLLDVRARCTFNVHVTNVRVCHSPGSVPIGLSDERWTGCDGWVASDAKLCIRTRVPFSWSTHLKDANQNTYRNLNVGKTKNISVVRKIYFVIRASSPGCIHRHAGLTSLVCGGAEVAPDPTQVGKRAHTLLARHCVLGYRTAFRQLIVEKSTAEPVLFCANICSVSTFVPCQRLRHSAMLEGNAVNYVCRYISLLVSSEVVGHCKLGRLGRRFFMFIYEQSLRMIAAVSLFFKNL